MWRLKYSLFHQYRSRSSFLYLLKRLTRPALRTAASAFLGDEEEEEKGIRPSLHIRSRAAHHGCPYGAYVAAACHLFYLIAASLLNEHITLLHMRTDGIFGCAAASYRSGAQSYHSPHGAACTLLALAPGGAARHGRHRAAGRGNISKAGTAEGENGLAGIAIMLAAHQ